VNAEAAERAASAVDGFVSTAEGRLLYELARSARGSVVEIGSWKGRSTIWLAYGARDGNGGTVYAIDPHAGSQDHVDKDESSTLDEFISNIQKSAVGENIIPLVMSSEEAHNKVPCPVGVLFLDGPSEETMVRGEVARWLPCLSDRASIAIHDTVSMPGPRGAAEHLYLSSKFVDVRLVDTITYARATGNASVREKLIELERLMVRRAEIILGSINYPMPIRKLGRRVLNTLSK
jgi:hypothetical protein